MCTSIHGVGADITVETPVSSPTVCTLQLRQLPLLPQPTHIAGFTVAVGHGGRAVLLCLAYSPLVREGTAFANLPGRGETQ